MTKNGSFFKDLIKRVYRADVAAHGQKYYDGDNADVETSISIID